MRLHFYGGRFPPLCFRSANPGYGFLPQHKNDTQPGMECQDAVADDSKIGKITENVCQVLSGWNEWGMENNSFFTGGSGQYSSFVCVLYRSV